MARGTDTGPRNPVKLSPGVQHGAVCGSLFGTAGVLEMADVAGGQVPLAVGEEGAGDEETGEGAAEDVQAGVCHCPAPGMRSHEGGGTVHGVVRFSRWASWPSSVTRMFPVSGSRTKAS